jgi:MFS family permease
MHRHGDAGHRSNMPSDRERQARAATTLIFFMTGFVYAAWATRIPAIKADLDLSAGALGLAILGLEAGAITGLPAGGALAATAGSRTALRIGYAFYPAALAGVALAPSLPALAASLAAMAAASSVVDVAMNAQGMELERRYRRPVLSGLHAGHPFGLVAGGLAGSAAAASGVAVSAHLGVVAAVGLAGGVGATFWLIEEPTQPRGRAFTRPSGRLLGLGLIAFCAFLLDGAAYNWSAAHLSSEHGAGAGLAAAASGLAIAAPGAEVSLAGWALFGLGLAALAPTVLGAAPAADHGSPAAAIAAVTTVGYLGSFTGPPLVGALAEAGSLTAALGLLVVVSGAMVLLAPRLRG